METVSVTKGPTLVGMMKINSSSGFVRDFRRSRDMIGVAVCEQAGDWDERPVIQEVQNVFCIGSWVNNDGRS